MSTDFDCRSCTACNQAILRVDEVFRRNSHRLQKVRELALKIRAGIDAISPFIQRTTEIICPLCKNVCCITKHGYFNNEDIIYFTALGLKPPAVEINRNENDPCQFLNARGCAMERSLRPSGCNWYFCDSLLDRMEADPAYPVFDDALQELASLWLNLMEEFARVSAIEEA